LRAGWRLVLFVLFFFLFLMLASGLLLLLRVPMSMRVSLTPGTMLAVEGTELCAALAAAAIMGLAEGRPFSVYGLPRGGAFGTRFWQGVLWGLAMITAMIFLIRAFGGFSFEGLALAAPGAFRYGLLWALIFLFVGFFEEFMFRGYPQFALAMGIGFWPAAVVLSAGFAAVHRLNGGEDWIGVLSVFAVAMFFCLTLKRTGNLWFAVGLHSAFDWGESFLYSVPDSGIVAPGHLLNSSLHGPAWLTGGSVGPEGSVMAFAVVAIVSLLFARAYPPRASGEVVLGEQTGNGS
jgi:uncharacterized protein